MEQDFHEDFQRKPVDEDFQDIHISEGTDALVSEQKPLDTLVAGSNPVALKLH